MWACKICILNYKKLVAYMSKYDNYHSDDIYHDADDH
jgi:hypothetical protein